MGREHFSVAGCTLLSSIPAGSKIHVSGVAGVAMAQLAVALAESGYQVTGSDKEFYEPMGSFLRSSSVVLRQGYAAENIADDVALVVIGNALSYGNPEILAVEQRNLPYTFFSKTLFDLAIQGRHSIVASGTHGKSTTSALIAFLLTSLQDNPSYFVGAVVPALPRSLCVGAQKVCVVEGDEYDSAFFAKVPKFAFYRPDTLIVTAIEYDHADIYPNLEAIEREFSQLIASMPAAGVAICCVDDPVVARLLPQWRASSRCQFVTYGRAADADVRITSIILEGQQQRISLLERSGTSSFSLSIPGAHNALNATAALIACQRVGHSREAVAQFLPAFGGARRRQEVRLNTERAVVIDDFAHHPSAVRETVAAIRSFYPGRRLWAIFEPRSNTSRRKVFQAEYVTAFRQADQVVLCQVHTRAIDAGQELLDVGELAQEISTAGTPALTLPDAAAITAHVVAHARPGDLFLVMSNGGFDRMVERLCEALASK